MYRQLRSMAIVAGVLLIAGCVPEPQQQLSAAKSTLDGADSADADIFCEKQFNHARWLLDSAAALIAAQQRAPAFMRSYKVAEQLLIDSRSAAQAALDSLPPARERYRNETAWLVESARGVVTQTLDAARAAVKSGKKAEGIEGDIKDMQEMVAASAAALDNGDLVRSRSIATSVIDKAGRYRSLVGQLPRPSDHFAAGKAAAKKQ